MTGQFVSKENFSLLIEKYRYFVLVLPILVWLPLVAPLAPAVMQDELVYSEHSRLLESSEWLFPNAGYFAVFSIVDLFGSNFYLATKFLNLFFFQLAGVFVYAYSRLFFNGSLSILLSLLFLLSPLGLFTTVFMPEASSFLFGIAALYFLTRFLRDGRFSFVVLSATSLALGAAFKPHLAFLIAPLALIVYLAIKAKFGTRFFRTAIFLSVFIVIRLGVGFLIAGPNGLNILGPTYTNFFNSFIGNLFASPEASAASSISLGAVSSGIEMFDLVDLFATWLLQLIFTLGAVSFILGPLFAVLVAGLRKVNLERGIIYLSFGWMILLGTGFASAVTVMGDDHSDRLLLRYFEYLIPLLIIVTLPLLKEPAKFSTRAFSAAVATIFSLLFVFSAQQFKFQLIDSSYLSGLQNNSILSWTFLAIATTMILVWLFAGLSKIYIILFSSVLTLWLSTAAYSDVASDSGLFSYVDRAGITASQVLANVPASEIVIVSPNKQQAELLAFHLSKPSIDRVLVPSGTMVSGDSVQEDKSWVISLAGADFEGEVNYRKSGEGFSISRVNSSDLHVFAETMISGPLDISNEKLIPTTWGAWSTDPKLRLYFNEDLKPGDSVKLQYLANQETKYTILNATVGGETFELDMQEAGQAMSATIPVSEIVTSLDLKATAGGVNPFGLIELEVIRAD